MYKKSNSTSGGDTLIGSGGLIWGYDETFPDQIIQSSFIDEMSHVSNEVKDLVSVLKQKEDHLKEQENLLSKQQLQVDMKERELNSQQVKIAMEMDKLEKGTMGTIVTLEKSISELKRENQRLRDSFQVISKSNSAVKYDLELTQSKNSKLEKQLASANSRIANLIKLQDLKSKEKEEQTEQDKEDIECPKQKIRKPRQEKVHHCCANNKELIILLMKALSNTDRHHFSYLFEEVFQHQFSGLLSSLANYLKQVAGNSAVVQYPVLKLTLKSINVMNDSEMSSPTVKVVCRKLSEILCINEQYSNSPQLHNRIISSLILTRSSLQVAVLVSVLKKLLEDVQEEGGSDIFLDNCGHQVLLHSLKDPIQQKGILNIMVMITSNSETSTPILREILPSLSEFINLAEDGDVELTASISIILQRISIIPGARFKLKQASSLFRRILNENKCKNSLIELNMKAVLMNIDNFRQVPNC